MKFQVLDGKHQVFTSAEEGNPGGSILIDLYMKNDIVESDVDLALKHNRGARKFKRVADDTPVKCSQPQQVSQTLQKPSSPKVSPIEPLEEPKEEPLDENVDDVFSKLTIKQLRRLAEEEEIDLGEATKKSEILKIFRDDVGE